MYISILKHSLNLEERNDSVDVFVITEIYINKSENIKFQRFCYFHQDAINPFAEDLVCLCKDNSIYAFDYFQRIDRAWRDCFGMVSDELSDLWPVEFIEAKLVTSTGRQLLQVENQSV